MVRERVIEFKAKKLALVIALGAVLGLFPLAAYAQSSGSLTAGSANLSAHSEVQATQKGESGLVATSLTSSASVTYRPVYRLNNMRSPDHLFTVGKGERNAIAPVGWSYEGISWLAPSSGAPVYRLSKRSTGEHFYTVSAYERAVLLRNGWRNESVAFYSCGANDVGSVPIYRVRSRSGWHFFTASLYERNALIRSGWHSEGVAFYGRAAGNYPDDMQVISGVLDTTTGSPVSFNPLYRLYNSSNGHHLLTTSKFERNALYNAWWTYEGSPAQLPSAGYAIHRLYNPRNGEHLYTTNTYESGVIATSGWRYEGVCGYAATSAVSNRVPLYRLYNPRSGLHHYTVSSYEKTVLARSGWRYEGVAFYCVSHNSGFRDDLAQGKRSISGDSSLDSRLASILASHNSLRSAFNYVVGFSYKSGNRFYGGSYYLSDSTTKAYAKEMLNNGGGNCYRYASLFCWLARGLGYNARVVSGWVPSLSSGKAPHGWVEIYSGGTTYVCDPDLAHEHPGRNWYMFTYGNAPTSYHGW